jgi:hypothetical protein
MNSVFNREAVIRRDYPGGIPERPPAMKAAVIQRTEIGPEDVVITTVHSAFIAGPTRPKISHLRADAQTLIDKLKLKRSNISNEIRSVDFTISIVDLRVTGANSTKAVFDTIADLHELVCSKEKRS